MDKRKVKLRDSIGIDIGESALKVARIRLVGRDFILQNYGFFPTPKGAINNGEIIDERLLEEALRECFHDAKIRKGRGVLGISGKHVIVRITELPMMPQEELKEAVGWDISQYISFPLEEAVYDYYVLGPIKDKGIEKLRVLVAAAPVSLVNEYIKLLSSVGITLYAVDIKSLALLRLFENVELEVRGAYVIIDIGAMTTSIVIMKNGEFAFSRDVLLGGRDFTQGIMKSLNVSEDEAEHIKKEIDSHPKKEEIYTVITPIMDDFVLEITRSLTYFRENIESVQVFNKIFLTGGGAKLSGFPSYLESGIGIKIDNLDPLRSIKIGHSNLKTISELKDFFGVAIGLSKRGLEGE